MAIAKGKGHGVSRKLRKHAYVAPVVDSRTTVGGDDRTTVGGDDRTTT